MSRSLLCAAVLLVACSSDKPAPAPAPAPTPTPAPPAPVAKPAQDPRITELFAAGKDCKWSEEGVLQACPATDKLQTLTIANQGDTALAGACMTGLHDPATVTRLLAAWCLHGFNGVTQAKLLPQALDLIEAEKELPVRNAIAFAFSGASAHDAGVDDRVIALVRKLAPQPADDFTASSLLDTLFPQYLVGNAAVPSRAAGDLALAMVAKKGTRLQTRALEVIALMTDRLPEVCAAYGDMIAAAGDDWAKGVLELATPKDGCPAQVDVAVDAMVRAMQANKYNTYEYQATKRYLERVPLTAAQQAKLVPACAKLEAKAEGVWKDSARQVGTLCRKKTN